MMKLSTSLVILFLSFGTLLAQNNSVPGTTAEMRSITNRNSPAHQSARKFMRGANLGNYLEAPPKQNWGAKYTADDFIHIRAEGFDHVRIPIAWNHYAGPAPDFKLSDDIYGKVDFLVTNALNQQLAVIVNIHHFDDFTKDPMAQTAKFYGIWRQLAVHYREFPTTVAFELLNEPKDAATTAVLNPIYAEAIRLIRQTNPTRPIFVGPGKWNQVSELPNLRLPGNDDNLIVTIHCYDPFYFTHQGASWAGPDVKTTGIIFPGPPSTPLSPDAASANKASVRDWIQRYNTLPAGKNPSSPLVFREKLQSAKQWSERFGRPIHLGEFGCYTKADPESRARFYSEFRKALNEVGFGWAVWDWKAGFKYWDEKTGEPAPGMRAALFPERK
jgi:endoglucanase